MGFDLAGNIVEQIQALDMEERDAGRQMQGEERVEMPMHVHSPSLRRHNSQVERYLTSSTVRRRKLKHTHCNFCVREENGEDFVRHLRRSRSCWMLYMRTLKVHSFENVLLMLFSCQMCGETKTVNFTKHLQKNDRCLAGYREKYKPV